jgi:hypothetical protein
LTAHLAVRSAKAIVWARSTSVNEGASAVVVVRAVIFTPSRSGVDGRSGRGERGHVPRVRVPFLSHSPRRWISLQAEEIGTKSATIDDVKCLRSRRRP